MTRKISFFVAGVLMFFAVKEANAVCWNLSPFIDIIRAKVGDASSEHWIVNGVWFATGSYLTPVVGSLECEFGGGANRRLGIIASGQEVGIGTATIEGTVNATTLGGSWQIMDSAGTVISSGSLVTVSCASNPVPVASTSGAAGPTAVPVPQR